MPQVNLNIAFVTINTPSGPVGPGWDATKINAVVRATNQVWRSANIMFVVHQQNNHTLSMPGTSSSAVIDNAGFFFLQSQVAPRGRITVGLVNQVAGRVTAGMATVGGRFTVQPHVGVTETYKPLALAHELGHILGLEHVTSDSRNPQERLAATNNLMTPGIIRSNPILTAPQIATATANITARSRPAR